MHTGVRNLRVGAWLRRCAYLLRPIVQPSHLILVAKAAVTATGAWLIGHLFPGDMPDYAYYAPLGALVAMAPTVASSVMASLKAVLGVLLGLAVAWLLIFSGLYGVLALFFAIAISSLISGISWLGPGKSYIPFAAAFVFLSGGSEPAEFSVGLTVQFVLGAVLGVAANVVFPPPIQAQSAKQQVIDLRQALTETLAKFGRWVSDGAVAHDASAWREQLDQASQQASETSDFIDYTDLNRRGNIRAKSMHIDLGDEHRELALLRSFIQEMYQLAELPPELERVRGDEEKAQLRIPVDITTPLAHSCEALQALLEVDTFDANNEVTQEVDHAAQALHEAHEAARERTELSSTIREWVFVAVHVFRKIARQSAQSRGDSDSPR